MRPEPTNALDLLAEHARHLADVCHFPWPSSIQHTVQRLRLDQAKLNPLTLVAIVGGASSGKSTVFNNLLDGQCVSQVTAKGHATRGLIMAVHLHHEQMLERLLESDRLLPGFQRNHIDLNTNTEGHPDGLCVVYHTVEPLRDVILFDTPDFTSDSARLEGDVAWAVLPWFDKIIAVVDHERWFDRQSISQLRKETTQLAQSRFALFNRTRDEELTPDQAALLGQQAVRIGANAHTILEFRRGRGFRQFAPGTLNDVHDFLRAPLENRTAGLSRHLAAAASHVLNQNDERLARLTELRNVLDAARTRSLPTQRACMTALMTAQERKHLDLAARVLRWDDTTAWFGAQGRKIQAALGRIPIVGTLVGDTQTSNLPPIETDTLDRTDLALNFLSAVTKRQESDVRRATQRSAFWDEIQKWTGLTPSSQAIEIPDESHRETKRIAAEFDDAMTGWTKRVEQHVQGLSPHVKGALGVGAVGLAIVLIAVPGPVAALTFVSAKGAVAGALSSLFAATGAGALFGKPLARLTDALYEKLMGSAEYRRVKQLTIELRRVLEDTGRHFAQNVMDEAGRLTLAKEEPILHALETVSLTVAQTVDGQSS